MPNFSRTLDMIAKTSLVRLRETNCNQCKSQAIFKTTLIKAREMQTHKVQMLRIKEGAKISLKERDFSITMVKVKMQKHQMEPKANATHREKTFREAVTT